MKTESKRAEASVEQSWCEGYGVIEHGVETRSRIERKRPGAITEVTQTRRLLLQDVLEPPEIAAVAGRGDPAILPDRQTNNRG